MRKGFTLIEILIYTALLGMIMGAAILITKSSLEARAKNRSALILNENMHFAITRLEARVHAAIDITAPASGSANSLTLSMTDSSKNPTVFNLSGGVLKITESSGNATALTSDEIEITNLTFTRLTGTPTAVRIQLDGRLRNAVGVYQSTLSLTDTAVIRR